MRLGTSSAVAVVPGASILGAGILGALVLAGCADHEAPTWPTDELTIEGEPRSLEVTALEVTWPSAADDTNVEAYLVRIDGEPAARLDPGTHAYAIDELDPALEHRIEVLAVDAAGNESSALVSRTGDLIAPRFAEGALGARSTADRWAGEPLSVVLTWPTADDEVGVVAYVLRVDGEEVARSEAPASMEVLTGVSLETSRTFSVVAVDAAGHESEALSTSDVFAPTFPTGARLERHVEGPADAQTLRLSWPQASDDVGITGYAVRRGTELLAEVGPEVLEHELGPLGEDIYTYSVAALDAVGHDHRLTWGDGRLQAEQAQAQVEEMLLGALGDSGALQNVLAGAAVVGNSEDILAQAEGVGVASSNLPELRGGDAPSGGLGSLRSRRSGLGGLRAGRSGLGGLGSGAGSGEAESLERGGGQIAERRRRGRVEMGQPSSPTGPGTFDSALVTRMFRARIRAMRGCYERELRSTPTLAGRVGVSLTITPTGSVRSARATENTSASPRLEACVVNVARRLRFRPGPTGGNVSYEYPFTFTPLE